MILHEEGLRGDQIVWLRTACDLWQKLQTKAGSPDERRSWTHELQHAIRHMQSKTRTAFEMAKRGIG